MGAHGSKTWICDTPTVGSRLGTICEHRTRTSKRLFGETELSAVELPEARHYGYLDVCSFVEGVTQQCWTKAFVVLVGHHVLVFGGHTANSKLKAGVSISHSECLIDTMTSDIIEPISTGRKHNMGERRHQLHITRVSDGLCVGLCFPDNKMLEGWLWTVYDIQRRAQTVKHLQRGFSYSEGSDVSTGSAHSNPEGDLVLIEDDIFTRTAAATVNEIAQWSSADFDGILDARQQTNSTGTPHDRLSGYASFATVSGDSYTGDVKLLLKHGWGTLVKANGDTLSGEWVNDELEGVGTHTAAGLEGWAYRYNGSFTRSQRNGSGTLTLPGGEEWAARWRQGVVEHGCKGRASLANGCTYEGGCGPSAHDPSAPVCSGFGSLRCRCGNTIAGVFEQGHVRNGTRGVIRYHSGSLYFGDLTSAGLPSGYGELYLSAPAALTVSATHQTPAVSGAIMCGCSASSSVLETLSQDLLWYKGQHSAGLPHGRGVVKFRDRSLPNNRGGSSKETSGVGAFWGIKRSGKVHDIDSNESRSCLSTCDDGTSTSSGDVGVHFDNDEEEDEEEVPVEDNDEDDEEDDDELPLTPIGRGASHFPHRRFPSSNNAADDIDYEVKINHGVLEKQDSSCLRLAALRIARCELRRLERALRWEESALQALRTRRMCLMCQCSEMDALLPQCSHVCLCVQCAKKSNICPLCKSSYDNSRIVRIFTT